ncbi:MAG TPA: hypothetical protein VI837_00310 [Blastocatellia bacterium]|nr:hypothetical protein [Blastocatellia bacterium]
MLESVCREVTRLYGGDEATIPTDYRELVKEFGERLKLATPQKPQADAAVRWRRDQSDQS